MGSPRNYSHITVDNINKGVKYHVSLDDISNLNYCMESIADIYRRIGGMEMLSAEVGPGETAMIDTFVGDKYFACNWYLAIIDDTRLNMRNSMIMAVWNYLTNNIEMDENFTYIGDFSSISYDVDMVSGHVRLFITNTGTGLWTIQGRRQQV